MGVAVIAAGRVDQIAAEPDQGPILASQIELNRRYLEPAQNLLNLVRARCRCQKRGRNNRYRQQPDASRHNKVLSHQCPSPSRHGLTYREVQQTRTLLTSADQ